MAEWNGMDFGTIWQDINWDRVDMAALVGKVKESYKKEMDKMKHVNIVLAGKTGVGKSTLVNGVFREQFAETAIGDPVTKELRVYTKEGMPLRIYDSKGLELAEESQRQLKQEIHSLIRDKLRKKDADQFIHVIWYCISTASDRIEEEEVKWIQELSDCQEALVPVIVVLTKSYSKKRGRELRDYIEKKNLNVKRIIPVLAEDYELEEDQSVAAYGLEELVQATFDVLPDSAKKAFINSQQVDIGLKEKEARKFVHSFAATALAEGAAPLPWADAPIMVATQVTMIGAITAIFGVDLNRAMITAIVTSVVGTGGATMIGRSIAGNLFKMIPEAGSVVGGAISGGTAMVVTTALGEAYIKIMKMVASGDIRKEDLTKTTIIHKMRELFKNEIKIAKIKRD